MDVLSSVLRLVFYISTALAKDLVKAILITTTKPLNGVLISGNTYNNPVSGFAICAGFIYLKLKVKLILNLTPIFKFILLNLNFIIAISLYTRIIFIKYAHVSSIENLQTIFFLFFLFTFFYLGKIILTQFIGNVFEVSNASAEYIYNFTTICKSLGLMLIPALFIFYTAPENFFNFIFYTSIILSTIFVLLFIWRGLSTAYKLLYRGVYHFFIYVCVVEISVVFLFFKLLTKTII